MKITTFYFLLSIILISSTLSAQTDVTTQHLQNAGFDSNFNYGTSTTGNISGDIINNVHGWTKDMNATYTVAGTFAYGSGATFNASNPIPNAGHLGSAGGALALSSGWGTTLNYSQNVTLKSGKYSIATAYYNAGSATAGNSIVGWLPGGNKTPALSKVNIFPLGTWVTDTISFFVLEDTQGKIQAGYTSRSGVGSGSSAKLLIDYVHLIYYGTDKTQLTSVIAEAETMYGDGSGITAEELLALINDAKAILEDEDATMIQIVSITNALIDAIALYKLSNASEENPIDMTYFIVNNSFESAFTGWTNAGMATQTNTAFPLKDGLNYIERWVNRGTRVPDVSIQQTITNIPNGKYTLTAAAGNIQQIAAGGTVNNSATPQTGVTLFAGHRSVAVDTIKNRTVSFVVFDNQIVIGLKAVNATGNWVTADNFRLRYEGNQLTVYAAFVADLILQAQSLLNATMLVADREQLLSAITFGEQSTSAEALNFDSLKLANTSLLSAINFANTSIAVCSSLQAALNSALAIYADGTGINAAALNIKIVAAQELLTDLTGNVQQIQNATDELNRAIFAYRLANASGTVPTVVTNPNFARGATAAFGRSTITGVTISSLLEHGFCWSTHPEPTVMDNRTTKFFSNNGNVYHLQNLEPSTVYYIRAYAMTQNYAVGYGNVIKVITIPKGTITYQLNSSVTSAEGHHERIAEAMRSAVEYWNNLTSIKGKHLSINYNAGTPTAEASYSGYMQFGANPSFQRTGTALHEMGHNIGVGQHSRWYGPNSPLRAEGTRGAWLGERANAVLRFLDNNPNATMTGDNVHMWPYGINGAHEDTGSEFLYIANSLITQGLGEDGLPPTGGFSTPAYTFRSETGVKYYLKSEDASTGRSTSYLKIDQAGRIANVVMRAADVLSNDSAAWYLDFNPVTSYYRIRNVATGKYFSYVQTGVNGIGLLQKANPGTAENFQLKGSRINTQVVSGGKTFTAKGYWITRPEHTLNPPTFTAMQSTSTTTATFNLANSATTQRWFILNEDEVDEFDKVIVSSNYQLNDAASAIVVYTENKRLHLEKIPYGSEVHIYDISGRIIQRADQISGSCVFELSQGIFIVTIKNKDLHVSKKVQL